MSNKCFIIIGGGYHQLALIKELKKGGYCLIVVDINPKAPGFEYADYKIIYDSYDYRNVYKKLIPIVESNKIIGVMTQAARGTIPTTAYLAEKFGTRWLNFKTAMLTIDKNKISGIFNRKILIPSVDEVGKFPVIIKDARYSGSTGIYKINDKSELEEFKGNFNREEIESFVVEEYVQGRHLMIFGLQTKNFTKIYGIAEKYLNDIMKTDFVIFPAELDHDIHNKLIDYTHYTLQKINFDFGPFMIELIFQDSGEIFFAEIEGALQGSYFSELMIPSVVNSSPIIDSIKVVLGEDIEEKVKTYPLLYAQKYFYPKKKGKIRSIKLTNCISGVKLYPYIGVDEKIINPNLYFLNAILIGNSNNRRQMIEHLKKCKADIVYK